MSEAALLYDEDFKETSFEEFIEMVNLPENQGKVYELIDGYVYMMAGNATTNHHRISGYISRKVGNYLEGKPCEIFQDINMYLFREDIGECKNVYQPDILVGCDKNKMTDRGYEGTPEFIVEVISKSTATKDYFVKPKMYMEFGVKEYWIADPYIKQVVVYTNNGDNSPVVEKYTFDDEVTIGIFGDLSIDFKEILKIIT